jgi:hypothetical protein
LEYVDGLRGNGQPVTNSITYDGRAYCNSDECAWGLPGLSFGAKEIRLCPVRGCSELAAELCSQTYFLRGDTNADGAVDISDAIREFMFLFLGADAPSCMDAADSNNDERVDISDGIHILEDFFRYESGIPYPGPRFCGPDPWQVGDALDCAEYAPCAAS